MHNSREILHFVQNDTCFLCVILIVHSVEGSHPDCGWPNVKSSRASTHMSSRGRREPDVAISVGGGVKRQVP